MTLEKVDIIGVPMHIVRPEKLEETILELLANSGTKQIVFLSVWNLLKARGKNDYAECVRNADLVLPVSKSILWAAEFLKRTQPSRYNPFTFVIDFFSVLESRFKSVYLLGGHKKSLEKAESNVRATFPKLQVVGRYTGYFSKQMEQPVVQAIYKSSPSLVLVSEGVKEKDLWAYRRRNQFSNSTFFYYRDCIGIFSERIKRIDEKTFDKGHEIYLDVFRNPLKLFLIFPFLYFVFVVFWYRFFKK